MINIQFPIVSIIGNEYVVFQKSSDYFVCPKNYIPTLNKLQEFIIDTHGKYYKRKLVSFKRYINLLGGFSLKFGRFGICYLNKEFELIMNLSIEDLRKIGIKLLNANRNKYLNGDINIKKWRMEFEAFNDKEEMLRYLFFFADTSRYYNPDKKDSKWRERKGFVHDRW